MNIISSSRKETTKDVILRIESNEFVMYFHSEHQFFYIKLVKNSCVLLY